METVLKTLSTRIIDSANAPSPFFVVFLILPLQSGQSLNLKEGYEEFRLINKHAEWSDISEESLCTSCLCGQKIGFNCGQMPIRVELHSEQPSGAFRFASDLNRGNVPRLRPSL